MRAGVLACTALAVATAALAAGAHAATVSVVARGLDNPRGVAVASDGTVYVAEAGRAGKACLGAPGEATCLGYTGKLTMVATDGTQRTVAAGFASAGGRDGSFVVGVDDVAINYADGRPWVIMTDDPRGRAALPRRVARQAGKVLRVTPSGYKAIEADVGAYETASNPDGRDVNPNPYSLAIAGTEIVATDAGGNTLFRVNPDGTVTLLAVLPEQKVGDQTFQSVPTSVAIGPDGAIYVGELAEGAGAGGARVYRVAPGGEPEVWASGLTQIVGIDVGPDGSVYVAQLSSGTGRDFDGAVIRIAPDGTKTELASVPAPGGLALGPDGSVYVSTNSVFPERGQVVRIAE